jgi:hypothetical protein
MAKMLGVWMNINNPGRSPKEDLNLTVGGTIVLTRQDVAKLVPGGLFQVRIKVMDDDTFSDDVVHTDESFERGVYDTNPTAFEVGVIVPATKLRNSEPSYESAAEIYCRVVAEQRNAQGRVVIGTNAANSQTENVSI